jgi:hypothetical protein
MKKIIGILPVFILLMVIVPVFAQNSNQTQVSEEEIEREIQEEKLKQQEALKDAYKEGEIASCFDYYTNGNVQINLTQDYTAYDAGRPILIRGTVKNTNTYPVIGVDIKARLVKDIPAPDKMRAEIMILDEFDVVENITIDAQGEYILSYSYLLPYNAPSGEYQMYFYAVEQDKFNLSGLPTTNNIVGSKISFDVNGETPDHVYLDQTQILVNALPYNTMSTPTQYSATNTPTIVTIPLYNSSKEEKIMTVIYDLYASDSTDSKNKISTKTEQVTVPSKSETIVTYTIDKIAEPVYYLSISAKPTTQTKKESVFREKTIANIKIFAQGIHTSEINFTTIESYPLERGKENKLVTCFQDVNNIEGIETVVKVETTLKDADGTKLAYTLYEGNILGATGIMKKFTPTRKSSHFTITSTMYDSKNTIIDQVEKTYSCTNLNPDSCLENNDNTLILSLLLVCIGLIGAGFLIYKKKINIERV